jgi:hypothetical protein
MGGAYLERGEIGGDELGSTATDDLDERLADGRLADDGPARDECPKGDDAH